MRDYQAARYDDAINAVKALRAASDRRVACQAAFITDASRLRVKDDESARRGLFATLEKCYNSTVPVGGDTARIRVLAVAVLAERAAAAARLTDLDKLERIMKLDLPSDRMNVYDPSDASGTKVAGTVKVQDYLSLQRARILVETGRMADAAPLLDRLDWSSGKAPWKGSVVSLNVAVGELRKRAGL